jgi:hypothetical protein
MPPLLLLNGLSVSVNLKPIAHHLADGAMELTNTQLETDSAP